ncbi:MAG: 1-acyl-sn-glycerol-3-phosphate acyltransferase, partial [Actinophytocola sp.]
MVAPFRRSTEPTRRTGAERVSPIWQAMTFLDRGFVRLAGRMEITGTIPPEFRDGPSLIAAN